MPGNADAILHFIESLGRKPQHLVRIVITHSHIDHMGSAAELKARTGAAVLAHRNEATLTADAMNVFGPMERAREAHLHGCWHALACSNPAQLMFW